MAINLNNFTLSDKDVLGGGKRAILVVARDDMEFIDKKPTGKRLGSRYEIVCHANGFTPLAVKIPAAPLVITQNKIDEANASEAFIFASFVNFEGKLYQSFKSPDKDVRVTATATDIKLVNQAGEPIK